MIEDITLSPQGNIFGFDLFEWEDIEPDSLATIMVLFTPRGESEYEAVLTIESNDRDQPVIEINLHGTALSINGKENPYPTFFGIEKIYPNPFNSSAEINYTLPFGADIIVEIYDIRGRKVVELLNKHQIAGKYRIIWSGSDFNGKSVSSGVYFYKTTVVSENNVQYRSVREMVMLK